MCPNCNYDPDWQARQEKPPADYDGDFLRGPEMKREDGLTMVLMGCPACKHVWMDY